MVIGIVNFDIYMEGNRSLKDKRRQVKSLIGKTRSKFPNISIAEVDSLDKWNRATIGFTFLSNDVSFVNSTIDQILYFIEQKSGFYLSNTEREIINT